MAGFFIARLVSRFASHLASRRLGPHHVAIVRRVVFYGLFLLFMMSAMRELGFKISVLLGAAGVLSVAIGFASQTSASNLISGMFLLGEKPFQVGDMIEVDGLRGEILSIDLLSLKLRTPDNLYVRIPNETLIKSNVINYTRFPLRRIDLIIAIGVQESVERARQILLEVVEKHPLCMEEPKPFVLMTSFSAAAVDLQLSFFVRKDIILNTRSEVLQAIKQRFDEVGVEVPMTRTRIYSGEPAKPFPIRLETESTQKPDEGLVRAQEHTG